METFETFEFYRGMSEVYPIDRPIVKKTRKDRAPRDTKTLIHSAADNWFLNRFGVNYRSQAVLVTSRQDFARKYAATVDHVYRIIPMGKYSFCWSPFATDMLELVYDVSESEACQSKLASAMYQEIDLAAAHEAGHEVMLFCDQYVAIPVGLCGNAINGPVSDTNKSKIILA